VKAVRCSEDPEPFRKLTEELWRHSDECLKSLAESQMRDIQAVLQKWFDLASQGATKWIADRSTMPKR
jgi:hypothetical protein